MSKVFFLFQEADKGIKIKEEPFSVFSARNCFERTWIGQKLQSHKDRGSQRITPNAREFEKGLP